MPILRTWSYCIATRRGWPSKTQKVVKKLKETTSSSNDRFVSKRAALANFASAAYGKEASAAIICATMHTGVAFTVIYGLWP